MSEEQIERIDKYINGELSAEQKNAFDQELLVNKDLQQALDVQIQLIRAVKKAGLKNMIQKIGSGYRKWSKIKKWVIRIIVGLVTLSIVAILVLKYFHFDVIKDFMEYAEAKSVSSIQNRADSTLTKQIFVINNQQDTVIETKDGIVLFIPANASVDEDGEVVEGTVNYQIQEALKPSDIILAELDTRSNGNLLETGGMFKIMADQNGYRLQINPKKQITAQVPTYAHKEGMQLYDGEYLHDGNINWVNPKPLENYLVPVDIKLLNFLPAELEHEVQFRLHLDMKDPIYFHKPLYDSLYFSFSGNYSMVLNHEPIAVSHDLEKQSANTTLEKGTILFEKNCITCHAANSVLVGPALSRISNRRTTDWLKKWIKNPAAMIASGDPYAVKLAAEYKSAGVMSAFPDLKEDDIECIISYMDSPGFGFGKKMPGNSDTTTVSFHPVTVRGIDPASVKAFWNKDYNNTILATREFEKRMRVIHTTCKQAVLDLYIKNLDKNLWQIDEMASKLLDGDLKRKFQDFARLKNGKVKSDARQVAYLTKYYNKKYEAAKRILKNNLEAQRKLEYAKEVLKETVEGKAFQRQEKLLKEEIELNTKEVYKQLGINPVKQEMAGKEFIKPPVYTASVSSFGWKNIDRLTEERQTFTISENGKTAKITYDLVLVKLKEPQRFDRVMAYLLPDKLSSFMKMKEVDNVFEEQLNKNIHYNLLIVGYEHDDICYFTQPDIKKGLIENIVLSKIHKKDFDQRINGLFSNYSAGIETDFRNEMLSVYQDVQEVRDKVSARKINGIRAELYHVVFPCADGYIYTKPTDPDLE